MGSNSQEFLDVAEQVKKMKSKPTDDELLELYGLFKQAVVGDVNIDRPGMLDFKGKAKWDRWESRKGLSKGDAEKQYIEVANRQINTYGLA